MKNARHFSIPTFNESEQRELFSQFARYGFQNLQLKAGQYARYDYDAARYLNEWKRGSAAGLICGGPLNEAGQNELRLVCKFAGQIGAPLVVICHGCPHDATTDSDREKFARILSKIAGEVAHDGVMLSLHHHYDQPIMTRDDLRVFFSTAENVGLTIDTAHLWKSGETSIADIIRQFAPFIDNVHLKDFSEGQFQTLGQGEIPFTPIFKALKEIQYDGPLCVDEESGAGVQQSLADTQKFLDKFMKEANAQQN